MFGQGGESGKLPRRSAQSRLRHLLPRRHPSINRTLTAYTFMNALICDVRCFPCTYARIAPAAFPTTTLFDAFPRHPAQQGACYFVELWVVDMRLEVGEERGNLLVM